MQNLPCVTREMVAGHRIAQTAKQHPLSAAVADPASAAQPLRARTDCTNVQQDVRHVRSCACAAAAVCGVGLTADEVRLGELCCDVGQAATNRRWPRKHERRRWAMSTCFEVHRRQCAAMLKPAALGAAVTAADCAAVAAAAAAALQSSCAGLRLSLIHISQGIVR